MPMLKEFREFAMRGNVVDLAVGIIIGGAFGQIVNSLVNDVVMPPIGAITKGVDFAELKLPVKSAVMEGEKIVRPAVDIGYGKFINAGINFVIVAFAVFLLVKAMNAARKKPEPAPAKPAPTPRQEVLLEEIRDLLKAA